ncbi:hypothetical protein [Pseudomonas sp. PA15(2017)]|nr:hypothetical protein [Pseudomonas sp. PA15(2017)]
MHDAHITRYMRLKIQARQEREWQDLKLFMLCHIPVIAVVVIAAWAFS